MKPGVLGAGLMLTAAICFSIADVIVKLAADRLTVWQISFGQYLLGGVVIFFLARGSTSRLFGQERGLLVLQAVLGTAAMAFLILGIQMLPLSLALILLYLFPAFAALFSPLICREQVSAVEWGAVAAAVCGAIIILWPSQLASFLNWGFLFIMAASVLAGIQINLIRRLGATDTAATIFFYHCLIGAAICLPLLLLQSQPIVPTRLSLLGLVILASAALVGHLLMNHSFKMVNSTRGGILLMSELVIGAAFGIIFLGDPVSPRLIIGAGLILGCGVVLTLQPSTGPAALVAAKDEGIAEAPWR